MSKSVQVCPCTCGITRIDDATKQRVFSDRRAWCGTTSVWENMRCDKTCDHVKDSLNKLQVWEDLNHHQLITLKKKFSRSEVIGGYPPPPPPPPDLSQSALKSNETWRITPLPSKLYHFHPPKPITVADLTPVYQTDTTLCEHSTWARPTDWDKFSTRICVGVPPGEVRP